MSPHALLLRVFAAAAVAGSLHAGAARGQTPATQAAPPPAGEPSAPPPTQTTLTVVGAGPANRSTIDRRSYSLGTDLQKTSGSLGDVLRDVPSVQVDSDGNVSLRGDPDVTILVDGKPSAIFSGPARAQAIQSMSAGQFDRVEVMTNPPAGVTAQGSGGVINLISRAPPKSGSKPVASGSLKANIGSGDRFDLGADGSYTANGLSITGGVDIRQSGFYRAIGSQYDIPGPTTGSLIPALGVQTQKHSTLATTLYGSLGYDVDAKDHLDLGLNVISERANENQTTSYATGPDVGSQALDYAAAGVRPGHFTSVSESLGWDHKLSPAGEDLSAKVQVSDGRFIFQDRATYQFLVPAGPNLYQALTQNAAFPNLDVKVDYKKPLGASAKLSLGFEDTLNWVREQSQGIQGAAPALAIVDQPYAQTFTTVQDVQAIYGAYDQTIGKLEIQPGVRFEETELKTDLVSPSGLRGEQNYFEVYPSLHLTWELNEDSQLKASYGRRAQQPEGGQLDPFRVYNTPTSYTAGNPDLRPAITGSYEFGYEYRHKSDGLEATIFYKDKSNLLTTVTNDVGGDVLLSTWANLGHAHDLGLELTASHNIFKNLAVNGSFQLMRSDVDAANLGILNTRSALVESGQLTIKWTVTSKDLVQFNSQASGRQLNAQGYRGGAIFSDLGWRHQFDGRLSLLVTADDPFGLSRRTIVINTPTLDETDKRKFNNAAIFIGLTYAFGAAAKGAAGDLHLDSHSSGSP